MATWSEVQAHVRGKYRLQSDTPQHFILTWQVDDNRPQNFKGELTVATQDIHCQPLVFGEHELIVLRAEICTEHLLSSRNALLHSARLVAGGLVLSGNHYFLRYSLPLRTLELAELDFWLLYIVREAATLHQKVTKRVEDSV